MTLTWTPSAFISAFKPPGANNCLDVLKKSNKSKSLMKRVFSFMRNPKPRFNQQTSPLLCPIFIAALPMAWSAWYVPDASANPRLAPTLKSHFKKKMSREKSSPNLAFLLCILYSITSTCSAWSKIKQDYHLNPSDPNTAALGAGKKRR